MRHTYTHLEKGFNFEFMKGGGGQMPPQPSPREQAEARIWEDQQRAQTEERKAKREEKTRLAKEATDKADSASRVGRAYDSAVSDSLSRLGAAGLDATSGYGAEISNLLRANLNRSRAGAPAIVTDANALFSPTAYDDAYSTVRSTARGKLSKQADAFMGEGFETNYFADTSDDEILRSILGEQEKDLQTRIEQAYARGQINDAGKSRALRDFDTAKSAAFSKANSLGAGVLANYRKNLGDYAGTQRKRIDNFDFSDNINLDGIRTSLDSKAKGYQDAMRGDILAAIGGTKFFDEDALLGTATGASGVTNNVQTPLATAGSTPLTAQNALSTLYGDRTQGNTDGDTKKNQVF